jgi:hypothetical protein
VVCLPMGCEHSMIIDRGDRKMGKRRSQQRKVSSRKMQQPCAGDGQFAARIAYAAGGKGALSARRRLPCAGGGRVRRHPAPRRRACAPSNPDSIPLHAKCLARMPTGRLEQAANERCLAQQKHGYGQMQAETQDLALGTTEACAGGLIVRQASNAGGLGACYAPQRGARGAAPARKNVVRNVKELGARGAEPACNSEDFFPLNR